MRDLYLRFENEDEAKNHLYPFVFDINEENGETNLPNISVDLVGVIVRSVGEGDSIESITEEGYHVNLRVIDDEIDLSSLEDFIISPKTPYRVWA